MCVCIRAPDPKQLFQIITKTNNYTFTYFLNSFSSNVRFSSFSFRPGLFLKCISDGEGDARYSCIAPSLGMNIWVKIIFCLSVWSSQEVIEVLSEKSSSSMDTSSILMSSSQYSILQHLSSLKCILTKRERLSLSQKLASQLAIYPLNAPSTVFENE